MNRVLKERGTKVLRYGAQTPTVHLRGRRAEQGPRHNLIPCPRRRTLGASPTYEVMPQAYSAELQFHASAACVIALLMLMLPAHAAPKENAAKDTVQVQTALSGAGSSSRESNPGDLVADAVRQTGSAQAALVPADEISSAALIPAGKTDPAKIVATLHYADDPSDTVVVLTLTGAQLLQVAERSVSRAPEPFEGFLQVSGLQIRYSAGQPEGKRISLAGIGGGEVDAGKTYKVATTRSLAAGGLGYFQTLTGNAASDTGISLAKSLSNYLAAHPVINNTIEDRIAKN